MIHTFKLDSQKINNRLVDGFVQHENNPAIRRTHLFYDRYENIYLTDEHIPELSELMKLITSYASSILKRRDIRAGYWFNHMSAGAVTTRHRHDDDDELLSAVYYVDVPAGSGDLILYDTEPPTRITPETGQLIFFPPDLDHEVTTNNSDKTRLSIGINFGPIDKDEGTDEDDD